MTRKARWFLYVGLAALVVLGACYAASWSLQRTLGRHLASYGLQVHVQSMVLTPRPSISMRGLEIQGDAGQRLSVDSLSVHWTWRDLIHLMWKPQSFEMGHVRYTPCHRLSPFSLQGEPRAVLGGLVAWVPEGHIRSVQWRGDEQWSFEDVRLRHDSQGGMCLGAVVQAPYWKKHRIDLEWNPKLSKVFVESHIDLPYEGGDPLHLQAWVKVPQASGQAYEAHAMLQGPYTVMAEGSLDSSFQKLQGKVWTPEDQNDLVMSMDGVYDFYTEKWGGKGRFEVRDGKAFWRHIPSSWQPPARPQRFVVSLEKLFEQSLIHWSFQGQDVSLPYGLTVEAIEAQGSLEEGRDWLQSFYQGLLKQACSGKVQGVKWKDFFFLDQAQITKTKSDVHVAYDGVCQSKRLHGALGVHLIDAHKSSIHICKGVWGEHAFHVTSPVEWVWHDGWTLTPIHLRIADFLLRTSDLSWKNGEYQGSLWGENWNILPFLPIKDGLQEARISWSCKLQGRWPNVVSQLKATGACRVPGLLQPFHFEGKGHTTPDDLWQTDVQITGPDLLIEQHWQGMKGTWTIKGSMEPYRLWLHPMGCDIHGRVVGEGRIELQDLTTKPRLYGQISWSDASFYQDYLDLDLYGGRIECQCEGDHMRITHASFLARPQGQCGGQGRLNFDPWFFQGRLDFRDIDLALFSENLSLKGSGSAESSVSAQQGRVDVIFDVAEAHYQLQDEDNVFLPPYELVVQHPDVRDRYPFAITLDLRIAPHLIIKGSSLDTLFKGRLQGAGDAQKVSFRGQLDLVKGTIEAMGKRMSLSQGMVIFHEKESMPDLSLQMVRQVEGFQLTMMLSGTSDQMNTTVSSLPPLSPDDALSYWLFDKKVSDISPTQMIKLLEQMSMKKKSVFYMLNNIGSGLGLSTLDFHVTEDSDGQQRGRFEARRRFNHALAMRYDQELQGGTSPYATLEWAVTPRLLLESDTKGGVGASWRMSY